MKKIILALLLSLLMITSIFAADAVIGDGTGSTSYMPFYGLYDYGWSHFILPGDAITNAIDITNLEFNVYNTPSNYVSTDQYVYMRTTTEAAVTADYTDMTGTTDYTLVYSGDVTWNGSGWQGIELTTPFAYDGTSNIEIIWENRDGAYASGPTFYKTDATTAGAYKYADTTFPAVAGESVGYYPNTRLTWLLEGEPAAPTLVSPANLVSNVATNVEFTWTTGANTDHTVLYLADNVDFTDATVENPATSSYTTSLENGTTYYWKVVAVGTTTPALESSSAVNSFTTDFGVVTLPYSDNFDGVTAGTGVQPAGWTALNTTGNSSAYSYVYSNDYTVYYNSAPNSYKMYNSSASTGAIIASTPKMQNTNKMVSFSAKASSAGYTLIVGTMSDATDATTFVELETIELTSTYAEYSVQFPAESAAMHVSFKHGFGGTYRSIYIDDVSVEEIIAGTPIAPTLVSPANLATGVAIDGDLTWTTGANTDHAVLYIAEDAAFTTSTIVNPATSPYSFSLEESQTYYWKVVAVNTTSGNETESAVWSFTTITPAFPNADIIFDGIRVESQPIPMNPFFNYSMTQSIYYQSELNISGSAITSVSYLYNNNSAWDETIEIYMGHTTKDVFDTTSDWILEGFTNVYSGSISVNTTEPIVTIDLDLPFTYNNTDNLVVLFFATDSSCAGSSDDFYSYQVTGNRSLNQYSDTVINYNSFINETTLAVGTLKAYLPVTGFNYQELGADPEFSVSPENLTFATHVMNDLSNPKNISVSNLGLGDLGITSIVKAGTNANQFQLIDSNTYPTTLTTGNSMTVQVVYAPTTAGDHTAELQITDDQGGPAHIVQIEGNSVDANIYENDMPYTIGFEDEADLLGWTAELTSTSTSATAGRYNSTAHTGDYSFRIYHPYVYTINTLVEVSSPLVVPNMDGHRVSFWAKQSSSNTSPLVIGTYDANMTTFTPIQSLALTTTYTKYTVEMTGNGNERLGMKYETAASYTTTYVYIDDLTLEESPQGALIQITPDVKDFGNVHVEYEATQTFTIANNGVLDTTINEVTVPNGYSMESAVTTFPHALAVGASFTVDVTFAPIAVLSYSGNLKVKEGGGFASIYHNVALTGTGIPVPQGANCSNPIALTFPTGVITGTTDGFIDDYSDAGLDIYSEYLDGDDIVYQFNLTQGWLLNGTVTTTDESMGVFIVQAEPDADTPVDVIAYDDYYSYFDYYEYDYIYTDPVEFENEFLPAGTYYLIISSDSYDQSIDYTMNLTADPLPLPGIATNPSPGIAATNQPTNLTLSWSNATYTESLELWFGEVGNMAQVEGIVGVIDEYEKTGLAQGTIYNWKVVDKNLTGPSETEATVWSFTTISDPPLAVTNPSPAHQAINRPVATGTLSWSASVGAEEYRVYLSTDNTFADVVTPFVVESGLSYTYTGLEYATTYYWKVHPWNEAGEPTEGIEVWSFTTVVDPTIPMPLTLDFEGTTTVPAQITQKNMTVTASGHGSSSNVLYKSYYSYTTTNGYAQFQSMNNISATSAMKFDYRIVSTTSPYSAQTLIDNHDYITVKASTDNGGTFTAIDQINSLTHTASATMARHTVDIGQFEGQSIIFRFESVPDATNAYYIDLDNIFFGEPATAPIASLSETNLDFGIVNINETATADVTITNMGVGTLDIGTIAIIGDDNTEFSFTTEAGASMILAEGQALAITVEFAPLSAGTKTATLQIPDQLASKYRVSSVSRVNNNTRNTNEVALAGECVDPTIYSLPFTEGFEVGNTDASTAVSYWTQISEAGDLTWTINSALTTYNRTPRNGSYNATLRYGNTDWLMRAIQLTGGQSYDVSLYARQDGSTSTNSNVGIYYGTAATTASMTSITGPVGIVNGDYQLITGTFIPETTGIYYIGIKGFMNSSPWYISIDDISIMETPTVPVASLSTDEVDFGEVEVGLESEVQPVTITNVGPGTLTINSIEITGTHDDLFAWEYAAEDPQDLALENNESLVINVTFSPDAVGAKVANLVINDDRGSAKNIRVSSNSKANNNNRAANTVALTGMGWEPPMGDNHRNPFVLTLAETITETGITTDFSVSYAFCTSQSVVYKLTLPTDLMMSVSLDGTTWDTKMWMFNSYQQIEDASTLSSLSISDYWFYNDDYGYPDYWSWMSEREVPAGEYYIVIAGYSTNNGAYTLTVETAPITPDIPINVVMDMDANEITISWDAADNANSYNIYACDTPDGVYDLIPVASVSGLTHTFTATDTMKFYKVMASSDTVGTPAKGFNRRGRN